MEKNKLDWIISIIREQMVAEDAPTNNVGGGRGSRKLWMQYLKNK